LEKHKTTNQTPFIQFLFVWVTDNLRATYLARTGKFWVQSPSRSLARSTTFCVYIGWKMDRNLLCLHWSYRSVCGFTELL